MSEALEARKAGPIRFALGQLWNQNFRLVPSGTAFSLSLFLLMNNPASIVKIPAIILVNSISLHCAARLNKVKFPSISRSSLLLYLAVDIYFLVCLHNVVYFAHTPESTRIVMVSNFCVAFILLAFVSVPFAVWSTLPGVPATEILKFAKLTPKRMVILSLAFIAVGWIVIFPYVFVGLPFAQLIIVGSARKVQS